MKKAIRNLLLLSIYLIHFISVTFATDNSETFYNLMIFVRFKGEKEFLGNEKLSSQYIRNIVDNTCNNSVYSINEYYKAVSNQKINLKTVYLFADENYSSFETSNSRGYYSKYNESLNPEGYMGQGTTSERWIKWLQDWGFKASNAINNGQKIYDGEGNIIPVSELDKNKDGKIDCISLIYSKSDNSGYFEADQDILWAYQGVTSQITLNIEGDKTITSGRFVQASIQMDEQSLYKDAKDKLFLTPSTLIHELGHFFGLKDLYYTGLYERMPVHTMSAMGKQYSPITQFFTSYERYALKWIGDKNITQIKENGTYSLKPIKDTFEDGRVAYKIKIPGQNSLWMYLEYKYVGNENVNKFNAYKSSLFKPDGSKATGVIRPGKSGLLVYVVNTASIFPENCYGRKNNIWDMEVIGGTSGTRSDAPREKGEDASYGDISIFVTECNDEKIEFTVNSKNGYEISDCIEVTNTSIKKQDSSNGGYEISKTIKNNYSYDKSVTVICASYTADDRINCIILFDKKQIKGKSEEQFTAYINNTFENCKFKYFIWDENINPYLPAELIYYNDLEKKFKITLISPQNI